MNEEERQKMYAEHYTYSIPLSKKEIIGLVFGIIVVLILQAGIIASAIILISSVLWYDMLLAVRYLISSPQL